MKKNNKGFTLVELLVTIMIMISILAISIVSFIKISDKKKKDTLELIKKQIETAAVEYFTANEYLFEGLSGDVKGIISLGTLINEDYIGVIINPITNKKISSCTEVEVLKKGSSYDANVIESTFNNIDKISCDSNYLITVKEMGAPNISINISKLDDKNNPYNNWYHDGAKFYLNVNENGNGKIIETKNCVSKSSICNPNVNGDTNEYRASTQDNNPSVYSCFMVTNTSGKKARRCAIAKIDNKAPSCTSSSSISSWTNKDVTIKGTCLDDGSGCKDNITRAVSDESKNSSGTSISPGSVYDNVGHITNCPNTKVYIDKTKPTGIITITSRDTKFPSRFVNAYIDASDSLSGVLKVVYKNTDYTSLSSGQNGYQKRLSLTNQTIASSYDGKSYTLAAKIYDNAGNIKDVSGKYTVYEECSKVTYKDGNTCSKTCGGGTKNRLAYDKYTNVRCSSKDQKNGGAACNTQSCVTLCEDININIPNWSGTKEYEVSSSSSSKITKISSVYYEAKPDASTGYTTNHEKNDSKKISKCEPPYYKCKAGYTYLAVCSTNKCGRKVCEYKQAGSTSQVRYFDNKKEK